MGLFSNLRQSTDGLVLSTTQKDIDVFFEQERVYLNDYHANIRTATTRSDVMTRAHKSVADSYIKLSSVLVQMATPVPTILPSEGGNHCYTEPCKELTKFYLRLGDTLEKMRKTENRVASDEDLKLSDLFRYYMRDTTAAKVRGE